MNNANVGTEIYNPEKCYFGPLLPASDTRESVDNAEPQEARQQRGIKRLAKSFCSIMETLHEFLDGDSCEYCHAVIEDGNNKGIIHEAGCRIGKLHGIASSLRDILPQPQQESERKE